MIRSTIALLAPALTLMAAPVAAQETQTTAAAKFSREFAASDTDKSGALSRAEVEARIAHMRVGAQRSNPQQAKQLAGLWFAKADANHDGKVTEGEAQALLALTFKRYDANGDGKIGTAERAAAKKDATKGR